MKILPMEKLKELYAKIKPFLPNKYITAILIFAVLMVFFDNNNLIKRMRYDRQARALKKEIRMYEQQREETLRQLEDLRVGTEELEKIAREQYLMKKENEDIFILE